MGKYLELFRGEVGDLTEKTKLENKPYVAYSTKEGKVVYTVIPKPVTSPADNEIWYTTVDGSMITPFSDRIGDAILQEHTYGKLKFSQPLTTLSGDLFSYFWLSEDEGEGRQISNENILSITLPNSIQEIYMGGFCNCVSLEEIILPNNLITIGNGNFTEMMWDNGGVFSHSSIKRITIPNTVTQIGHFSFYKCSNLLTVDIPNSVEIIGIRAFTYCSSLTSITYNGTMEQWNSIDQSADSFAGCDSIITVHCTDGDISIEPYDV